MSFGDRCVFYILKTNILHLKDGLFRSRFTHVQYINGNIAETVTGRILLRSGENDY